MEQARKLNFDKIGACASAVCAVHCLLTGVAIGLLSVLGLGFLGNPVADILFLGAALVVGFVAVRHGVRVHRSYAPASVFVSGLAFVVVGHFVFGHSHAGEINVPSTVFSVLGGLCLVLFHVLNWRLQQGRKCCHEAHCKHETQE